MEEKYFTYNLNEDVVSKTNPSADITTFPAWSKPEYSANSPSVIAVNKIWVNQQAVNSIRQKLRRRKNRNDFLEHYLYFLSTIWYLKMIDKRFENDEFVPVHYKTMSSIISRRQYKRIIKDLKDLQIIECNESYQVDAQSKGYKLLPPYNQNIKQRIVKDDLINKKLNNHKRQSYKDLSKLPFAYKYLAVSNTMIEIDYESAYTYNMETNFNSSNTGKYDAVFYSISNFRDKDYKFKVDPFANRAHSNLTNLPRDLRSYLTVQGDSLGQVDIKNAQPLFFYNHIKNNPQISESEKANYKLIVEKGEFYEFFMTRLKIDISKREEMKKKIIAGIFYDKYRAKDGRFMRVFRKEFPSIAEYIVNLRKKDNKSLARILQKAESKFVIEKAVTAFIKKYGSQGEFVSTIHDSIVVKTDMLPAAKQILKECFQEEGLNPKLKVSLF